MWEGPENPSNFMKDSVANTVAVSALRDKATEGKALDAPISLSRFFNPNTFLNALRQLTSRKGEQGDCFGFGCENQTTNARFFNNNFCL